MCGLASEAEESPEPATAQEPISSSSDDSVKGRLTSLVARLRNSTSIRDTSDDDDDTIGN